MIQRFIDYITVQNYSPRTVREYADDLRFWCQFLGVSVEEFDATQYDEEDVQLWLISMLDRGQSPRSVKRRLSAVKSLYKYLLRMGLVQKDITQIIQAPKVDKPLPVYFREQEMQAEKQLAQERFDPDEPDPVKKMMAMRDYLIIELFYQTGMRRAELAGLNDEDMDFHSKQIRILGKRRKIRIVPIGDRLLEGITDFIALRRAVVPDQNPQPLLVNRNRKGEWGRMTGSGIYTIVRARMGEVSTLQKHSPHVLRHTFATTMLRHGADIRTIQALLGHASLATTQIYTHTTFEQIRKEYAAAHPRSKKNN